MANKLILEKKALVVDEIASKIKENAGVVFVDYRGLSVPRTRLELAHPCEHQPLKLASLPFLHVALK